MLHDLIVKVCYKESLFYIITISVYTNLKYMIIIEKFWTLLLPDFITLLLHGCQAQTSESKIKFKNIKK